MIRTVIFLCAFACLAIQPARASSASAWTEDGASAIRIVSGRAAEPDGSVIMGVEIRLQPGWKTYWREPGEAGERRVRRVPAVGEQVDRPAADVLAVVREEQRAAGKGVQGQPLTARWRSSTRSVRSHVNGLSTPSAVVRPKWP